MLLPNRTAQPQAGDVLCGWETAQGVRHLTEKEGAPIKGRLSKRTPRASLIWWETDVPVTDRRRRFVGPVSLSPAGQLPWAPGWACSQRAQRGARASGPLGGELILQLSDTAGWSEISWARDTTKSSQLKTNKQTNKHTPSLNGEHGRDFSSRTLREQLRESVIKMCPPLLWGKGIDNFLFLPWNPFPIEK